MPTKNMLATVDLGSNSFRLQISKNTDGCLQIVDSIKEMVRLAAGLDEHKMLDTVSQQRALECLARFGERLRGFEADQVRAVATNTFRVAKNVEQFLPQAETTLGFPINIIAGREEARLIYTGVVHTIKREGKKMLVVDIGGGSTEFVIGSLLQPDITESLNLGCVSYSLRFFPKNKVSAKDFQAAINAARVEIQRIRSGLKHIGWDFAVGTSGSARAIRDIIHANNNHDFISLSGMKEIAGRIIRAGSAKKARLIGLKSDRVEVFAGGLAVMIAVFEELNIEKMHISDAALRDGVFYDMVGRSLNDDMRHQTVRDFQTRYGADLAQAERVGQLAEQCLSALVRHHKSDDLDMWRQYVHWAAQLHEIGLSIAHTGYHKHAAYILDNADMPGFSRTEQHILSVLVLGHRGDLKKMVAYASDTMLWRGILSLRLAALFCRGRRDLTLPALTTLDYDDAGKTFVLTLLQSWLRANPLTADTLAQESSLWKKTGQSLKLNTL